MTPLQYARVALLVFVVLLFPAGYLKGCSDEKERFEDFKRTQEAIAAAQRTQTLNIIAADKARKAAADAENSAALDALAGKLRHQRIRTIYLPPAPAASRCPDGQLCLDAAEYLGAYRDLVSEVRDAGDEGSKVAIDLQSARAWARSFPQP